MTPTFRDWHERNRTRAEAERVLLKLTVLEVDKPEDQAARRRILAREARP